MPLKLSIGLSRKVGLPEYGSLGASCHIELELESNLLSQDPVNLGDRARQAYAACAEAVEDALRRHRPADATRQNGHAGAHKNGRLDTPSMPLPATARQIEYIHRLASRIPGLDEQVLDALAQEHWYKPAAELDRHQASHLIDELRKLAAEHSPASRQSLSDPEWHDAQSWRMDDDQVQENGHPTDGGQSQQD